MLEASWAKKDLYRNPQINGLADSQLVFFIETILGTNKTLSIHLKGYLSNKLYIFILS